MLACKQLAQLLQLATANTYLVGRMWKGRGLLCCW